MKAENPTTNPDDKMVKLANKKANRSEKTGKKGGKAGRKPTPIRREKATVKKSVSRKVDIKAQKVVKRRQRAVQEEAPTVSPHHERSVEIIGHPLFSEYLGKKVGKRAIEVIGTLDTPQTDEKVAEVLGIKVNEVRRMLNVLNSYSVVRYDVNKDSKGWLTFKWYLDREKIVELGDNIILKAGRVEHRLPENCNDFFVCNKCYQDQKIVLPFENAFEMSFKCECGDKLRMISRVEAENLFAQDGKVL